MNRLRISCLDATLAGRVRFWRAQRGLSRSQAALRAHVTDGWLSHLEQGRILHPDPRKLRALAAALGCAYEDLMDAAGYTDAQPLPPELRDLMLTLQGLSPRQRNKLLRMVAILLEPEMQEPRLQRPQWVS